ncbi:MAG: putative GTP-binding protein EngB [Syntrophus sp. PtaB.Bin001]|jgi:GTP-binding protein|nr:MAG: putative GTP-binding protein EngB [Syntrophus sp. PtaB.Bin001]
MKILTVEFVKSATKPSGYPQGTMPEVAFVGRSNVGKSSLINTLLRRKQLARTSNRPGRTQLINFFNVNNELLFVDLPGYGFAKVPEAVKREWGPMIEAYLKDRENLMLVVFILDIRREPSKDDLALKEWLDYYGRKTLFILTKSDKLSRSEIKNRRRYIQKILVLPDLPFEFSAKSGYGRENIWEEIRKLKKPE